MLVNKNIFIILVVALAAVLLSYILITRDKNTSVNTSNNTSNTSNEIATLLSEQKILVNALMVNQNSASEKESRLLDLFTPLGPLEPYISNTDDVLDKFDNNKIMNIFFGYYFAQHGYSEEQTTTLAELPLQYASTEFIPQDYFRQNKSILDELNNRIQAEKEVEIFSYWSSDMGRINEYFYDGKNRIVWKLNKKDNYKYDFTNVTFYNFDDKELTNKIPEFISLENESLNIVKTKMASINVTTIYKCENITIYIMGATVDNAFGFAHGASKANDVNCGLLSNRFEMMKDEKLDDYWRFWLGR